MGLFIFKLPEGNDAGSLSVEKRAIAQDPDPELIGDIF
jgi:hypothetical protein